MTARLRLSCILLLLVFVAPAFGQTGQTPAPLQDKTIAVFGQTIHYWDIGSGPVVVLVHGLGSKKEDWLPVIVPLAQKYRLLIPDQIGFGHSDKPLIDYTIQTYVDFLNEFLQELKVEKASLVGESLGGWISAMYALEAADSKRMVPVERIVLVDAAGLSNEKGPPPLTLNPSSLDAMRRLMESVFYDTSWLTEETLEKLFAEKLASHDGYTVRSFLSNPVVASEMLDSRLAKIQVPTLVVWGRQDALVPLSSGERYAAGIPGAKLVTFEKCGHVPPLEKTAEFVAAVTEFLSAAPASAR